MSYTPPPLGLWRWLGQVGPDFVSRVNYVLEQGGVTAVNSWYRSETENRAAGGDEWSQHRYGLAVDLQTNEKTRSVAAAAAAAGLVAVPFHSGTAVHVQYYPAGALRNAGLSPEAWRTRWWA